MATMRSIVEDFTGTDDLAQTQRELVESLSALAVAKAEIFEYEIMQSLRSAGKGGQEQTVPISTIINSKIETRAYTSTSVDDIAKEVRQALKAFTSGTSEGVINGVTKLLGDALKLFFGEATASENTIDEYYVMTEGLSVVRVDCKAWYLNVSAKSVQEKMQLVTAVVAVKSAIDMAKIDFNTFLNLYQRQLFAGDVPAKDVAAQLEEVQEIYDLFRKYSSQRPLVEAPAPAVSIPPAASAVER